MSVLIVIPTVDGREDYLEACENAYQKTVSFSERSFYIAKNRPTCGEAWNAGAKFARELGVDYVHMTADDMIPHPGWYECAVETVEAGYIPSALVKYPDGGIQSHGVWATRYVDWTIVPQTLVPFCRPSQWIPIPNIHYFSDNAASSAFKHQGLEIAARVNYCFTHHMAEPGRQSLTEREEKIWKEWEATL